MPDKYIPLEANPDVFNAWSRPLGLPATPLSFQDLFSLDSEFLQFIPKPVKAVLLLFPQRGALAEARGAEKEHFDGDVWFIKQTIPNACGSIGLLHALLNLPDGSLEDDSALVKFKKESEGLDPVARAKLLDQATFFEAAHTAAIGIGQSAIPEGQDIDVDTHFIAFVEAKNKDGESRVVELDGGRSAPLDRGKCDNLLEDVAEIVKDKYFARAEGDVSFNMIVLAGEPEE